MVVEATQKKTTFHESHQLWEWHVMPFGMKNVPMTFQRVMDIVLQGLHHHKCYIDDILIHNRDFNEHLVDLEALFICL